nr:winged helix DNA-binding domain-containing protein [Actinopolymorpha cephalotaxi]
MAWRMRRQHLLERATPAGLVDVVARMGGLHAQVMSSVELSLGARVDGLALEDVREALWGQRTLVKLWAMRGTLHVLPARDLGVWLAALGTYRDGWPMYSMHDPLMHELAELVGHALRGRLLTRLELAAEVSRLSGSVAAGESLQGGWGGALKPASFLGRLCFAPSAGQRVRFTHPDTWIGAAPVRPAEDAAMAEIVRRFLGAYGPATPVDLAGWWGATRREATRMLALVEDQVTEVDVEGEPYWMLADQVAKLAATEPSEVVRLLPGFDQWTVCASRRVGPRSRPGPGTPALDPRHRTRIYRLQGWVSPVLLVDGRIEGVWRHERKGRRLLVDVETFRRLPRRTRESIGAETDRLAAFLGGVPELTFTSGCPPDRLLRLSSSGGRQCGVDEER